jgi:GNAT superfamily N-acetyltransferase
MCGRQIVILVDLAYYAIVPEVDGEVHGKAQLRKGYLYELDGPRVQLVAIVAVEDYQGKGIGAALMKYSGVREGEQGATRMSLTSGKPRGQAHGFCERRGYAANRRRIVKHG